MVVVAGFRVGVRGNAAGRVVWCSAKAGLCRLVGADGGLTPHFGSVAEGEVFLAERDSGVRGGFAGSAASVDAVSGVAGDGRGVVWGGVLECVGAVSAPDGALVVGSSVGSGVPACLVCGLVGSERFGDDWRVPVGGCVFGGGVSVRGLMVVGGA